MEAREKFRDDKGAERYRDTGAIVNPVWDACVEVLGYEPQTVSEKRLWGKMTTSLIGAQADRERILAVAKFYHKNWPTIDLTITAIEKWYSHFLRLKEGRAVVIEVCPDCKMGSGRHADGCSQIPAPVERTNEERISLERIRELTDQLSRGQTPS